MGRDDRSRWFNLNNPYSYRNENLRAMGFKSYQTYLKSPLWDDIRWRVLERAKRLCERCGRRADQVHHRAYDPATLRGESIHALSAVCGSCHQKAELHQKPGRVERGQRAYQRLQRANVAILTKRPYLSVKDRKNVLRALDDGRRALERWSASDDTAALEWFCSRM